MNARRTMALAIAALTFAPRAAIGDDAVRPLAATSLVITSAPLVRVRAVDPAIGSALQEGVRRSPTLAALVQRIDDSDGLVYLFGGPVRRLSKGICLRGGMSHAVKQVPPYRIITITVEARRGDYTIATIAHELRHAIEVLDAPEAIDRASVGRLYERIGYLVSPGINETEAAQTAGHQVYRELARSRR